MTPQTADETRTRMPEVENLNDWRGKDITGADGAKVGKLEDVYVDTETDDPMFGSIKEGLIAKHITFVPLLNATAMPDGLTVAVSKKRVKSAPNIERGSELGTIEERALYQHYGLAYTPARTPSGRRLARR